MALAPVAAPPKPKVDDATRPAERRASSPPKPKRRYWRPLRRLRLHWSLEAAVGCIATVVSILAYVYWAWRGLTLAYTDSISHMEIARHVWTANTPGLAQLGSAWLPLDHLLMLPLIWFDPLYRSGLAGAIPSMGAYVIGCVGMASLGRTLFHSTWAGALAAVAYGANSNLLYLQSTPMSESSMLAAAVLAAVFMARWIHVAARGGRRFRWRWRARIGAEKLEAGIAPAAGESFAARLRSAIARRPTSPQAAKGAALSGLPEVAPLVLLAASVCAATLVRYDGWALALAACAAVALVSFFLWGPQEARARVLVFSYLGFAGCVGWLLYNLFIFGDPLNFLHSNYSSGHQVQHIAGVSGLPTKGNLLLSFRDYAQTVVDVVGWQVAIIAGVGLLVAGVFLVALPVRQALRRRRDMSSAPPPEVDEADADSPKEWPLRAGLAWAAVISMLSVPLAFNWAALYAGTTVVVTPEVPTGNLWASLGVQHAYFNDRYGLMMLPLFALGIASLAPIARVALRRFDEAAAWGESALGKLRGALHRGIVAGAIAALALIGVASSVVGTPYVLADPLLGANATGSRSAVVDANWLRAHYYGGRILASTGAYAAMTFYTGLPDNDFLNESTRPDFDTALQEPQELATWIVFSVNSSSYDPVYDYLETRGNTRWQRYYTLVYQDGSTYIYERNS